MYRQKSKNGSKILFFIVKIFTILSSILSYILFICLSLYQTRKEFKIEKQSHLQVTHYWLNVYPPYIMIGLGNWIKNKGDI